MKVLGIDPGLRATGVAIWDGKRMVAKTIRPKGRDLQGRIQQLLNRMPLIAVKVAVIEKPQVYQGALQKGDPNDLIDLAILVGAVYGQLLADHVLLPTPAQWKGQAPKPVHHERIRKRVPGLGRCSKDALDAVGLCLYGVDHA
jgi:hypothetical protein